MSLLSVKVLFRDADWRRIGASFNAWKGRSVLNALHRIVAGLGCAAGRCRCCRSETGYHHVERAAYLYVFTVDTGTSAKSARCS